jgi:DNA recombination protein RmuC
MIGFLTLFIVSSVVAWSIVLHQQKKTQHQLLQLQTSTQYRLQQFQTSTQNDIHQLQIAQASTQATVAITQQETQQFVQEVQALHQTSHALMVEIKTFQSSSQAIIADLQKETTQLSQALRTNHQQGVWGEQTLRQVVQFAGMTQHCDFEVTPRFANGQVPDLLIHLPNAESGYLFGKRKIRFRRTVKVSTDPLSKLFG